MYKKCNLLIAFFLMMANICCSKMFIPHSSTSEICNYLSQQLLLQNTNNTLHLIHQVASPIGNHYTFQVLHNGIIVWGWKIKINIANDGKVLSQINDIGSIEELAALPNTLKMGNIKMINGAYCKRESTAVFYKYNNSWQVANAVRNKTLQSDSLTIINLNNEIINAYDCAMYLATDTTIKVKVFLPDPLSISNQYYGGIYIDNNDSNANWLSTARVQKNVVATFDSDSQKIFLKNNFVKLVDFNLPFIPIVYGTTDTFFYVRNESGFEDCNVMFHITNFHEYIASIGYGGLMNLQVHVDPHGQNGSDNSLFSSAGVHPILDFGIGGVDDAEDADVIVHEYAHGISWSANGNLVIDAERTSLDEGIADYFATSYSKAIDTFRWAEMFTWDGHNQYWEGRVANTTKKYSQPFILGKYAGGEVWNAAMMKIWDAIGQQATDKIMLQALYSFTDITTFPLAAAFVLQADSLLFNGIHRTTICNAFISKGIEPSWGCNSIKTIDAFLVYNQDKFSNNTGNVSVEFPLAQKIEMNIYNALGQLMMKKQFANTDRISISPEDFPSGVFIMKLLLDTKQYNTKLLHY